MTRIALEILNVNYAVKLEYSLALFLEAVLLMAQSQASASSRLCPPQAIYLPPEGPEPRGNDLSIDLIF